MPAECFATTKVSAFLPTEEIFSNFSVVSDYFGLAQPNFAASTTCKRLPFISNKRLFY